MKGGGAVPIAGRRRVHCSYHKCLTVYFQKVVGRLFGSPFGPAGAYRHFDSRIDTFYSECPGYAIASVNNHVLDLDRFEDIRVTRFVRDPRDLIVSGYFYHRRSAEPWCDIIAPTNEDWEVVNGTVPEALRTDRSGHRSFSQYLTQVPLEEGFLAELEFRRSHFESMRAWGNEDSRVKLFRYEEVLGNEIEVFDRIFRFFELSFTARQIGLHYARKFCASKRSNRDGHIRDPRSSQWRSILPRAVARKFNDEYGDLIEKLGYSLD